MAKPQYKFVLRLPTELRDRIAQAANRYRRSMNSEIVARLEYSLSGIPTDANESQLEPALFPFLESSFRRDLTDEEDTLIRMFRRLSPRQHAALLDLLTG